MDRSRAFTSQSSSQYLVAGHARLATLLDVLASRREHGLPMQDALAIIAVFCDSLAAMTKLCEVERRLEEVRGRWLTDPHAFFREG